MRVAARGLRIFSGMVDGFLVLAAAAMFGMIFVQLTDTVPAGRAGMLAAVAIPGFFWAVYHYIFLTYTEATPGMRLAHLRLSTFEGERVRAAQRRSRALAMTLSCMSVGFGFLWTFLDPDGLCWHDKITRTYVTQRTY